MKVLFISIILFFSFFFSALAKEPGYAGRVGVTPIRLEQVGDSLYVCVDFDIHGVNVDFRRSISLIPVLVAPGIKEVKLPDLVLKGRSNYLIYQRERALMSQKERERHDSLSMTYAVLKAYKNDSVKQVRYEKALPFEDWMRGARLDIQEDLCGCGRPVRSFVVARVINSVSLDASRSEPYVVKPHLAYAQPKAEAVKSREMSGEAFLDFIVNKTDIRPDYMNNPRELKKIRDMMEEVRTDKAITVQGITVLGYASPEGSYNANLKLSEGRASALVDYLVPYFDYPKEMYRVFFGGENWDGLIELVENSDMLDKNNILSILTKSFPGADNVASDARKKAIKTFKNAGPYVYMLKQYYPRLRKAICKINYEVKSFDTLEAKEVIKIHPQNLSLSEMFLVANTYPIGSQEFTDIFETAVRIFPHDEIANLNAAAATLSRGDVIMAERYLSKVKTESAEYNNAMGVLKLLNNDFQAAGSFLLKASSMGLKEANKNMEEMQKKLENLKQFIK